MWTELLSRRLLRRQAEAERDAWGPPVLLGPLCPLCAEPVARDGRTIGALGVLEDGREAHASCLLDRDVAAAAALPLGAVPWRQGRSVGRTVYDAGGRLIGLLDTAELAARAVAAVNGGEGSS